ncbi:GNAT family N-acetyltransferase [Clostridium vincentii]|uniref:TDP-fucosamine acetyltransferase n=1 Tax=Clostridium vincentii TaxID=52704 RepID=A0A2T0BJK7_9CLOT|nr:GNAT family N-acetyltransferase [Clostridium vincentii]PRR84078.1 TDP-fucosamine acetyltransferase [Clostridium vincentii]
MKNNNIESSVTFYELQWDTDYFGVNCSKAIIHKPLTLVEWYELKGRFKDYQFVTIENRNSESTNAQLIGKDTSAFLADVNIQFKKNLHDTYDKAQNITIHQALERNEQVIEIAEFLYSKFKEDPELVKRGGHQVYHQWLINSFGKLDKYFALSKNENGEINGFLLHSYSDNACIVELVAVSKNVVQGGIGTSLFRAVEYAAYERDCDEIRVGTQVRNMGAINFYHKVGCKQVGCHQVYHLWK